MKPLTAIQKLARGKDCTLRTPVCNRDPETVVLCHAPYPGRGGTRLHDWWSAFGCSSCHSVMDGRHKDGSFKQQYDPTVRNFEAVWLPAIHETQEIIIASGLMKNLKFSKNVLF